MLQKKNQVGSNSSSSEREIQIKESYNNTSGLLPSGVENSPVPKFQITHKKPKVYEYRPVTNANAYMANSFLPKPKTGRGKPVNIMLHQVPMREATDNFPESIHNTFESEQMNTQYDELYVHSQQNSNQHPHEKK